MAALDDCAERLVVMKTSESERVRRRDIFTVY
jgi:hypothetical protein